MESVKSPTKNLDFILEEKGITKYGEQRSNMMQTVY